MLIKHLKKGRKKGRKRDWCDQYPCLFDAMARQARRIDRGIIREGAGAASLLSIIQRQDCGGCWMEHVLGSVTARDNN